MPQQALAHFLGMKDIDPSQDHSSRMLLDDLKKFSQMETPLHTSARNVFQGRVYAVEPSGIMVCIRLKTAAGLSIVSLITDQSCTRLGIHKDTLVTASIKAPWVSVFPHKEEFNVQENCFPATIFKIRKDPLLTELSALLDEGSTVCSLTSAPCYFKETDRVYVTFKSLAVVLHTDLR